MASQPTTSSTGPRTPEPSMRFPLNSSSPPLPLPVEPTRRKLGISSLFFSSFSSISNTQASSSSNKMPFKASTFRGLGCTSVAEVSAPETVVRSSADWQAKSVRKKKQKGGRKKKQGSTSSGVVVPDVWCAPGIGFSTETSVDCVVTRRANTAPSRGRTDEELAPGPGERCCISRRTINDIERIYGHDSPVSYETRHPVSDFLPSGRYRNFRGLHRSGGLSEIIMFQTGFLLGGSERYDEYRELRLDVDNMSYEELLELGDKIGYVNTGLKEEEILRCLRKMKHSIFDTLPSHLSTGAENRCSICQEEYEANEEVGKLRCGHSYHLYCIKQWLRQKNACPVCKSAATKC